MRRNKQDTSKKKSAKVASPVQSPIGSYFSIQQFTMVLRSRLRELFVSDRQEAWAVHASPSFPYRGKVPLSFGILSSGVILIYKPTPILKSLSYHVAPDVLCRSGWPQTHRNLPASISQVLGLKTVYTTFLPASCLNSGKTYETVLRSSCKML